MLVIRSSGTMPGMPQNAATACLSPIAGHFGPARCRQCHGCLLMRQFEWQARFQLEKEDCGQAWFLTPSYAKGSVFFASYRDVQLYMKRTRKRLTPTGARLRFAAVGEKGGKNGRFHWHLLVCVCGTPDQVRAVRAADLRREWKFGGCKVKPATAGTAKYLAKYLTKSELPGALGRYRASLGFGSSVARRAISEAAKPVRALARAERMMAQAIPLIFKGVRIPKPVARAWINAERAALAKKWTPMFEGVSLEPEHVEAQRAVFLSSIARPAHDLLPAPSPSTSMEEACASSWWDDPTDDGSPALADLTKTDHWGRMRGQLRDALTTLPDRYAPLRKRIETHLADEWPDCFGPLEFKQRSSLAYLTEAVAFTLKLQGRADRSALPASVQRAKARAELAAAQARHDAADAAVNALARRIRVVAEKRRLSNETPPV